MQDERLRTLERHMSSWDFNEHTIFGMADLLGPDLLFFMMEHACRQFGLFDALKACGVISKKTRRQEAISTALQSLKS